MIGRIKRFGIQQRIMLYVAVGLTMMFSSFAFLGLSSIQQATELVYDERLSAAYMTAGILERDFLHVAQDVREVYPELLADSGQHLDSVANDLLDHLSETDPFLFFKVTGIWGLDAEGRLKVCAGRPEIAEDDYRASVRSSAADLSQGQFAVLPAPNGSAGGVPFASIVTRLGDEVASTSLVVAVHTVSINSSASYVPTAYWQSGPGQLISPTRPENPRATYHLEVVSGDGIAVLGIGQDEQPGALSPHFPVIQALMAERKAATLVHQPAADQTSGSHVMAVVPLASSSFYVVLEQPVDVALALPMKLRQAILVLTTLGFLATFLVAWVTTRHVVKPLEQLTAAAQRMAQGDLESPITISAQDEVGRLAESLDTMRQELKAAHQQVEATNKLLELQVRERTARLGEVLKKVISAQEEERFRLARELHDETAQTLGALSISLDRAREGLEGAPPPIMERILEARAIATHLLQETRRLMLDLRPLLLDDLGLAPAIRWYAETRLEEQGVATTVEVDQPATRLPKHVEVSLFRVIQEAVNNIARHANAGHARIRLAFRGSVASVLVVDDGQGFDLDRAISLGSPVTSVGLLGMQERVRLLNGRIEIRSQQGRGTEISVEIPIEEEAS